MGVLFLATQRIPVEIESNPNQSFIAWLPFGTLDIAMYTKYLVKKEREMTRLEAKET